MLCKPTLISKVVFIYIYIKYTQSMCKVYIIINIRTHYKRVYILKNAMLQFHLLQLSLKKKNKKILQNIYKYHIMCINICIYFLYIYIFFLNVKKKRNGFYERACAEAKNST